MINASTSATWASHSSRSAASRLSRSSGSVFDGRRLNHQLPACRRVSPSRRSWSAPGEGVADALDHRRRVVDLGVDLAARGVALERLAQHRQVLPGAAELVDQHHRRDQAAVGTVVAGEVVVRRVLTAEHGAGLGHHLLDERVADLRAHRHAAVLADRLGHGARADQVVEDRRPGVACAGSPLASSAVVVEPLRPLPVSSTTNTRSASPSKASPRSNDPDTHAGPQVALVGGLQRVGRMVGERAVELAVHHLELDHRQPLEHRRHDQAAHAVGGVGDDAQRADRRRRRRTTARARRIGR